MDCTCILQSGLYEGWVWQSLVDGVLKQNYNYRYYGLFNRPAMKIKRFMAPNPWEISNNYNAINSFLNKVENIKTTSVIFLNVSREDYNTKIPSTFKGRRHNYNNDISQWSKIWKLTNIIENDGKCNFLLRLREDNVWYVPIKLSFNFSNTIWAKPCFHWGGINDQLWYGRKKDVIKLHKTIYKQFYTFNWYNNEILFKRSLSILKLKHKFATIEDNVRLTASLGGIHNKNICFIPSNYRDGCTATKGGCGENITRPFPFCNTSQRRRSLCKL
jgi:hypothetical protein